MTTAPTVVTPEGEQVEEIDCSFCDTPIVPEVEDGDTAFDCWCGSWHHYDCAISCSAYVDDLKYSAEEDRRKDF